MKPCQSSFVLVPKGSNSSNGSKVGFHNRGSALPFLRIIPRNVYIRIYINMFFFTSWNIGVQWFNFKNIPFGHAHAGQHGPAIVQIFTTMHVLRTTEETPLSNLMGSLNLSSYYVHKQVGTAETERASSLEQRMEFRHNYCE